jgi:hypothetical protein
MMYRFTADHPDASLLDKYAIAGNKTVRVATFDAGSLIEGEVMVYRPDYSKK